MLLAISCTGKATPSPLTIQIKTPLFVAIIGVQKGVSKRVGQFPSEKPCIDACSKKGCLLDRVLQPAGLEDLGGYLLAGWYSMVSSLSYH